MQRTLCLLLTLGLATTALVPTLQAHEQDADVGVKLYLNRDDHGALSLTSLAPSARNSTTWSTGGYYYTSQGLKVEIRLTDPNPNWVIDEAQGVTGWVTYGFKQTKGGSVLSPIQGYNYGTFAWTMVQGERSSQMGQECAEWNETYDYRCDAYHYAATFPGHGDKPTPHTHGNGSDSERGLMSGDLEWVLSYTIPACTSMTSSSCMLGGQQMKWEFSILLDGTTFLEYAAIDEDHPEAEPATDETASNETEAGNETGSEGGSGGESGNETGNETGEGGEGSAFRPKSYSAQDPDGTAPGAGIGAILATIGAAGVLMRRRRD